MSMDEILFYEKPARSGIIGEIILNRPRVLNALSLEMCQRFFERLKQWETNDEIKAVLVKGVGDRAFCAGGDIRHFYENRDKNPQQLSEFFWHEYRLNALIHHFPKPYFAFLHHITMGGGAGVSMHGTYRIASDNVVFAMPETKIGFYPDIGASYFLNKCPGYTGLYLGLTGNSIQAADAYTLGLMTHIMTHDQIEWLEKALYQADIISNQLMDSFIINRGSTTLNDHINSINENFSADSVDSILHRLDTHNAWCRGIAQHIRKRSPTSLKVTFEAYHRAKTMGFDDIIQMDYDITQQFLKESDFFEGIRAVLIDKDQSPHWQPTASDDAIQTYFRFKGRLLL